MLPLLGQKMWERDFEVAIGTHFCRHHRRQNLIQPDSEYFNPERGRRIIRRIIKWRIGEPKWLRWREWWLIWARKRGWRWGGREDRISQRKSAFVKLIVSWCAEEQRQDARERWVVGQDPSWIKKYHGQKRKLKRKIQQVNWLCFANR